MWLIALHRVSIWTPVGMKSISTAGLAGSSLVVSLAQDVGCSQPSLAELVLCRHRYLPHCIPFPRAVICVGSDTSQPQQKGTWRVSTTQSDRRTQCLLYRSFLSTRAWLCLRILLSISPDLLTSCSCASRPRSYYGNMDHESSDSSGSASSRSRCFCVRSRRTVSAD
jgi:hypothetical protein